MIRFQPTAVQERAFAAAIAERSAALLYRPLRVSNDDSALFLPLDRLVRWGANQSDRPLRLPPNVGRSSFSTAAPTDIPLIVREQGRAGHRPYEPFHDMCTVLANATGETWASVCSRVRRWGDEDVRSMPAAQRASGTPEANVARLAVESLPHPPRAVVPEEHVWWLSLLELLCMPLADDRWLSLPGLLPGTFLGNRRDRFAGDTMSQIIAALLDRSSALSHARLWRVDPGTPPADMESHVRAAARAEGRSPEQEYEACVALAHHLQPQAAVAQLAGRLMCYEVRPVSLPIPRLLVAASALVGTGSAGGYWKVRVTHAWYRAILHPVLHNLSVTNEALTTIGTLLRGIWSESPHVSAEHDTAWGIVACEAVRTLTLRHIPAPDCASILQPMLRYVGEVGPERAQYLRDTIREAVPDVVRGVSRHGAGAVATLFSRYLEEESAYYERRGTSQEGRLVAAAGRAMRCERIIVNRQDARSYYATLR